MGELKGTQIQPRDLAGRGYTAGWHEALGLVTMVAVTLAESQGYDRAFNDNVVPDGETRKGLDGHTYTAGQVWQRDCGVMQIGIPASLIGSPEEEALYSWQHNVEQGFALYDARGFQPWAAYDTKVYLRDSYLGRASRGVGNFLAAKLLGLPTDEISGHPYEHTLSSPVLDFYYRVQHMAADARQAHAQTVKLKGQVMTPGNRQACDEIAHLLADAIAWPHK